MTVADINVRTWLSLGFETLKKKKVAILMDGTASSSPNALADIPYSQSAVRRRWLYALPFIGRRWWNRFRFSLLFSPICLLSGLILKTCDSGCSFYFHRKTRDRELFWCRNRTAREEAKSWESLAENMSTGQHVPSVRRWHLSAGFFRPRPKNVGRAVRRESETWPITTYFYDSTLVLRDKTGPKILKKLCGSLR